MYKRILVPLDQSGPAESILPHAQELVRQFEAEIILFHVTPDYAGAFGKGGSDREYAPIQRTVEEAAKVARDYLNGVADRYADLNIRTVVVQGKPAERILKYCKEEDISLVTMCTHGRSGLKRTLLGSVADEVMRESRLPVLLLRPATHQR
jgi:nucleotide-binding universal stress UspA family protein